MSTFAYYNYQFSKMISQPVQGNLFEWTEPPASPEENFLHKQEILSELLAADSDGSRRIVFTRARGGRTHLHRHLVPFADDVAVLKISNRRVRRVETIDFREEERPEYPACIVIIDNRPGVQRIEERVVPGGALNTMAALVGLAAQVYRRRVASVRAAGLKVGFRLPL